MSMNSDFEFNSKMQYLSWEMSSKSSTKTFTIQIWLIFTNERKKEQQL